MLPNFECPPSQKGAYRAMDENPSVIPTLYESLEKWGLMQYCLVTVSTIFSKQIADYTQGKYNVSEYCTVSECTSSF